MAIQYAAAFALAGAGALLFAMAFFVVVSLYRGDFD